MKNLIPIDVWFSGMREIGVHMQDTISLNIECVYHNFDSRAEAEAFYFAVEDICAERLIYMNYNKKQDFLVGSSQY